MPNGTAIAGKLDRLHRAADGWRAFGTAAATAAEVAGSRLPDRLAPRLWAERRALEPLGGGDAAVLLVAADGAVGWATWDGRSDERIAAPLAGDAP